MISDVTKSINVRLCNGICYKWNLVLGSVCHLIYVQWATNDWPRTWIREGGHTDPPCLESLSLLGPLFSPLDLQIADYAPGLPVSLLHAEFLSVSGPPWNLTLVWDKFFLKGSDLTQCLSKVIAGYLITEGLENFRMPTECSNAEPVDSHTNGTQMTSEGSCLIPKVS